MRLKTLVINLPTHAAHKTGVKVEKSDALLGHAFELLAKWERQLSNNKSTKDWANSWEKHNVKDALDILLNHVCHHIGVLEHRHLIKHHFLRQVAGFSSAKVSFALFDAGLGKPVAGLSDSCGPHDCTCVLGIGLNFPKTSIQVDLCVCSILFVGVSLMFQNGASQVAETYGGLLC